VCSLLVGNCARKHHWNFPTWTNVTSRHALTHVARENSREVSGEIYFSLDANHPPCEFGEHVTVLVLVPLVPCSHSALIDRRGDEACHESSMQPGSSFVLVSLHFSSLIVSVRSVLISRRCLSRYICLITDDNARMIMLISGDLLINNSILSAAFNSVCEREREKERERERERERRREGGRDGRVENPWKDTWTWIRITAMSNSDLSDPHRAIAVCRTRYLCQLA